MQHVLDYPSWCEIFPDLKATQPQVETAWNYATIYVKEYDNFLVAGDKLQALLNLATAHIVVLMYPSADGGGSGSSAEGIVASATEGSVSVSFAKPPSGTEWDYFWNLTRFGKLFLSMLKSLTAGGLYVGGKPETLAFRDVGGTW